MLVCISPAITSPATPPTFSFAKMLPYTRALQIVPLLCPAMPPTLLKFGVLIAKFVAKPSPLNGPLLLLPIVPVFVPATAPT